MPMRTVLVKIIKCTTGSSSWYYHEVGLVIIIDFGSRYTTNVGAWFWCCGKKWGWSHVIRECDFIIRKSVTEIKVRSIRCL